MIRFLTVEQVIAIHDAEKACTLLDYDRLAGAVGQPTATFEGRYLYPTLLQQAGVLLSGSCQAHAFEDANKRTAWLSCTTFLAINGIELLDVSERAAVKMVKDVARGRLNAADVTVWLAERS